jgi:hypothetical protein
MQNRRLKQGDQMYHFGSLAIDFQESQILRIKLDRSQREL